MPKANLALAAAIVFAAMTVAWVFRYSETSANPYAGAYRLDHWTGQITLCAHGSCDPLASN